MKNSGKNILLFILLLALFSCSKYLAPADSRNPCSLRYDSVCEEWKRLYPKEYAKYLERVKKQSKVEARNSDKH